MIWIYNLFLTLGALVWVPWMMWRARRRKEKVIWKERSGDYSFKLEKGRPRVWLHAVSVGEVVAALPILKELRAIDDSLEIVLSVTTSSGHQTAREQAQEHIDHLVYFPIDVYRFVLSALVKIRPTVVAIMETELWMNFLDACRQLEIPTLLINGRISDRSYPRSLKVKFFYKSLLLNLDFALMQTKTDADRISDLGAKNVEVFGNCKFDQAIDGFEADKGEWKDSLGVSNQRPVIVVGSSRGQVEEDFIIEAISGLNIDIIWAPRHLERVTALATRLAGSNIRVSQRSASGKLMHDEPSVMILDTYGELARVYAVADLVIIGGGFDNLGGQNLIQPLAHGKPVIHGPHMQNFKDVSEAASKIGATRVVSTPDELKVAIEELIANPELAQGMGEAAKEMISENLGASKRYAEAIYQQVQKAK